MDVCNHSLTYSINGYTNHKSPDDNYQDLKRMIAAAAGKAKRVNVIMPFLYEGRQHRRAGRESLDCAYMLTELADMGVDNFITFDAHDPRVQNATPLHGFDNFTPPYQFIRALLDVEDDLIIDKDHVTVISPDEGALDRAVYFGNVLGSSGLQPSSAAARRKFSSTFSFLSPREKLRFMLHRSPSLTPPARMVIRWLTMPVSLMAGKVRYSAPFFRERTIPGRIPAFLFSSSFFSIFYLI